LRIKSKGHELNQFYEIKDVFEREFNEFSFGKIHEKKIKKFSGFGFI